MALYDFGVFRFFVPVDGYLAVSRIFFDQFSAKASLAPLQ